MPTPLLLIRCCLTAAAAFDTPLFRFSLLLLLPLIIIATHIYAAAAIITCHAADAD